MTRIKTSLIRKGAISASWARCEQQHQMVRDAQRLNTMRLQSSEVAPRLEALLERTEGHRRLFRQLAVNSASAGYCTVVTDTSGFLIMLDNGDGKAKPTDWNGIHLGSCWDERIAGTNGVAMALLNTQQVTVRGVDHYLNKLSHFSCSAVPLMDAENQMIGVLSLAAIDRGNMVDYLFARQMLDATARRIHRNLFERKFKDADILCINSSEPQYLLGGNELVAVDEAGIIIGSTTWAHTLFDLYSPEELNGKSFELLSGVVNDSLRVPNRVLSIGNVSNTSLNVYKQIKKERSGSLQRAGSGSLKSDKRTSTNDANSLSLKDLSVGCKSMESSCGLAEKFFHRGLPFLIEGPSGSGKTAIITALLNSVEQSARAVVNIDCASLSESIDDQHYAKMLFEQARVIDSSDGLEQRASTIIFDNIDELPMHAQAGLRNLLSELETTHSGGQKASTLRIIATCKQSLQSRIEMHSFRDDLYYLLANTIIRVPSLTQRENPESLFQSVANWIAQCEVDITAEAIALLTSYCWPGNIRQLHSVMQQTLMEGNGKRIAPVDLASTAVSDDTSQQSNTSSKDSRLIKKMAYDEKTQIIDALHSANWNISQAARNLGIARATIHRKMNSHGIARPVG